MQAIEQAQDSLFLDDFQYAIFGNLDYIVQQNVHRWNTLYS